MWKLFPSSWHERAGVFRHRHAAAAEAFEENWLAWLEEGLRRVRPRMPHAQGSDAVEALRTLGGPALLELDETLRCRRFPRCRVCSPCCKPPKGATRIDVGDLLIWSWPLSSRNQ